MKKLFAVAAVMASFLATNAQTGTVLLGGDVAYSNSKINSGPNVFDVQNLSLNPYVGYQFNSNWTAGIVAGIISGKQEEGNNEFKNSEFNVGPLLRYTQQLSDLFAVYGQLEGRFGSRKQKNNGTTSGESKSTTLNLFPAVFINLKNSFGLNFNFGGITYARTKPEGGASSSNFNINFGRVGSIGISKNFGGKSK